MAKGRGRGDRCPTGKVRYRDSREAVAALHGSARARHWADLDGSFTRRQEVRHYACHACQGWHLTSQVEPELRPVAARPPVSLDPFVRSLRSAVPA